MIRSEDICGNSPRALRERRRLATRVQAASVHFLPPLAPAPAPRHLALLPPRPPAPPTPHLVLLDRQREEEDLLQAADLALRRRQRQPSASESGGKAGGKGSGDKPVAGWMLRGRPRLRAAPHSAPPATPSPAVRPPISLNHGVGHPVRFNACHSAAPAEPDCQGTPCRASFASRHGNFSIFQAVL